MKSLIIAAAAALSIAAIPASAHEMHHGGPPVVITPPVVAPVAPRVYPEYPYGMHRHAWAYPRYNYCWMHPYRCRMHDRAYDR